MPRQLWSLLLTLVMFVVGCAGAAGDNVSRLIQRIKQAQDSLGRFDLVVQVLRYSVDDANRLTDKSDMQGSLQRFVVLGDQYLASRDFFVKTPGRTTTRRHEMRGFDGKQSWSAIGYGRGAPTNTEPWPLPRRHDLLLGQFLGDLSLADALLLHDVQFEGETKVDGIPCQVLVISQLSGRKIRVWIATTRNDIPLKAEAFVEREGMTDKILSGFVSDWREVSAGVWFPHYIQVITSPGTATETFVESLTVVPPGTEYALTIPRIEIQDQEVKQTIADQATAWLPTLPAWAWMLIINDAILLAVALYFVARLVTQLYSRTRSDRSS